MASNKDSKTSKTAHVMNLLSKNRGTAAPAASEPAAAPAEPAAAPAPEPQAAPAAQPIAPIITSINADAAVSSQIRDALEASLNPAEPAVQAPPAPQPAPAPAPEPAPAAPAPQAAPETVPQAAPETAPAQSSAPAAPAAKAPRQEAYEPPAYVNVMEVLVREKAEKYMRASHTCCCDHCMVDVIAYTLNHLPPKYVVMSKGEMIPKLTFYEVQNSSDITTQLMRACEIVSKSPHHGRM